MATYTNLNNEIFAQSALEAFVKTLSPFSAFSRNFSPAVAQRGDQVLVPLIAALTATTFSSYAISGGTKTVVTVNINRHKIVHVGQSDLDAANSSEAVLADFGRAQGAALATAVLEDVLTLVTTGNFASSYSIALSALGVADLRTMRLQLNQSNVPASPRSALIDVLAYDQLLGVTNFVQAHMFRDSGVLEDGRIMRALGLDFHEVNTVFPATSSVMIFAAHPAAIAVAMRYLAPQEGNTYLRAGPVSDPETGLTMGLRDHYDNALGMRYTTLEANYGYSVGLTYAARFVRRADA